MVANGSEKPPRDIYKQDEIWKMSVRNENKQMIEWPSALRAGALAGLLPLQRGEAVTVGGCRGRQELNGLVGEIADAERDTLGRVLVRLQTSDDMMKTMRIQPSALKRGVHCGSGMDLIDDDACTTRTPSTCSTRRTVKSASTTSSCRSMARSASAGSLQSQAPSANGGLPWYGRVEATPMVRTGYLRKRDGGFYTKVTH
eukprot:gnl/MRDRNA2_/MRDRNA2_27476_c0_seq1.p1 gnl/MRDRNA2_/MRDRNA2_27476_c0~~gnl/MRDRNA2_/MRDRNA2_27476_c0_seq1.p1  ORF type:complete len:200 (-),score=32.71 gnl/MRDRNA2_/MRDRNA2_27476_c0_seq1:125-724(-)